MLEGLVANLLNRVLGLYVRNFDPKQLNIGIWSGQVKLKNLELRKEALDQLKLPLNVIEGHIGELTLVIPYNNLRGQPVKVNVEDVYILAAPKEETKYDPDEEDKRAHVVKMEKLESAELLKERNSEGMSKEEQKKQQSFVASLTTAIIDNLQVSVKSIHIRYEDSVSAPGHPFAVGLTLRDFTAESTDGNWKPTWVPATSDTTHKLAKLGALAIYWDTDAKLLGPGVDSNGSDLEHDDLFAQLKGMIVQNEEEAMTKHQFILKPVSGQAGIEMDKTGKIDHAKIKARVMFDELGFVLDDDQYRDALMLVDLFHWYIRHRANKKFRPAKNPKDDPQAWLHFAGKAVFDRIHERNRKWSWAYFAERRDQRIKYIQLFKKKKKEEKLSASEINEIDALEQALSYEDLRFWRSLARNQLRKENVGVKKVPEKQSWSSWVWNGGKSQAHEAEDDSQMSNEDREKLYAAIDWDEKKALADSVDLPKETIKMQLHLGLKTGSFTLKKDPHGRGSEVLRLLFDSFNTSFTQRPESFLAKVSLQGMRLYDGTTENSLFPQIISVKDAVETPDHLRIQAPESGEGGKALMTIRDEDLEESLKNAFFSLAFESNPLDGRADTALTLKLKGTEIVYNPSFVVGVVNFFKPPQRHMESLGALMDTAGETVEGIRKQTRAGLEFALEEHKTIDANFDLQAPLIIIPESVTQKTSLCLIIDAGHAGVTSDLVDRDTIRDIQSKQNQQYTDEDYQKLEGLMYDKFTLKLEATQILIGPSVEMTKASLDDRSETKNLHVVDKINIDFTIETCIVPKTTQLTKFRIAGKLPVLHAAISDAKYKNLMRLLDVAVPSFNDSNEADDGYVKTSAMTDAAQKPSKPIKSESKKSRRSSTLLEPSTSKSFQFSSQQHELVMEEEETNDQPREEKFKLAKLGDQNPDINLQQRTFEFRFVVEKLRGSLCRSDPDGGKPDQLLAELIAEEFHLEFYQRPFDVVAEVGLKTLTLEDHVEENPLPEFRYIVTSEDSSANSTSTKDLFRLKFIKVNAESPEFQPVYEGIATHIDASISTINLIVTRKTLLTLLDFVLVTFASPGNDVPSAPVPALEDDDSLGEEAQTAAEPQRMRIKADLKRIAVVLNNDGIRLATMSLDSAKVALTMVGKTMRLATNLGRLSLVDDVNQGAPIDSPLRQLLTIQGEDLADLTYETFDVGSDAYPGHDSAVHLRSGSIKINFIAEPFRKIMEFAVKFGKMQAIFNAARQAAANQATQIQERATRMQFDIVIRTPIVVFPRIVITDEPERDRLTAYLGEIYASNKFLPLDDTAESTIANEISAGIRNIRLASLLHYPDDKTEELQLIDKVDLNFKINMVDHRPEYKRPDMEVQGSLSNIGIKITSQQLKLLLELSRTIPQAFGTESADSLEEDVQQELPLATTKPAKEIVDSSTAEPVQSTAPTKLEPELVTEEGKWTKLDLVFKAGGVGLELFESSDDGPIGDLAQASLTQFSLNETNVKLRMISDGSMESELLIQSFTIKDTRKKDSNKYRKVMSLINNEITHQFMANITISGGSDRDLLAILTVDSPRIILSLDYLFAVQSFISAGFIGDDEINSEDISESEATLSDIEESSGGSITRGTAATSRSKSLADQDATVNNAMNVSFRVNLADAQVILLANAGLTSSEAIVLGMRQAIIAKQHAMTLQVEKVGMFLCRMDRFDNSRLRVLDDFSMTMSVDQRSHGVDSSMTNVQVDIEPLVLRLSLRDILLVMQIVSKASAMSGAPTQNEVDGKAERIKAIKNSSPKHGAKSGTRAKSSVVPHKSSRSTHGPVSTTSAVTDQKQTRASGILNREEMDMHIAGVRVVLIGDVHELPFLDWSVKQFDVSVHDWSAGLNADMNVDTFVNIYNFSKSAWEPFIEPWNIGFHMSRDAGSKKMSVDLYSRKSVEFTVTTATIALFSKSFEFLSTDEDVLSKPRGGDSPYRIRNQTGFTMDIWAQSEDGSEGSAGKLVDREECPWRFEDAITTRETLSPEGATGVVSIRLEDSGFESVEKIHINREGEQLYNLSPRKDKILHRILVEVKLGPDNIKYITFRSPLLVENNTQIPIELAVYHPDEGIISKLDPIAPGDAKPSPVGAAYGKSLLIRPDAGFGYTWSNDHLYWKDLLRKPTRTISCKGDQDESAPPFYFQTNAVFDKNDPLTGVYPYMRIRVSAPIELQNLLPYDFKYKIYDRKTKKDWTNFLRKGGVSPVHVVNLSHLLLLSVDLQDTPFKASEFAIINSAERDYSREKTLVVKDTDNLSLRLKVHYFNIPDSGGAFKISIYSPYVILNRTGLELDVRSKAFLSAARAAAGQRFIFANENNAQEPGKATPFMFSFPSDDQKNRALLRCGDSEWSKPQSFDAIGSLYDVVVPAQSGQEEMHLGVTVSQGEGKYNLTNVITVEPRFVLKNKIGEDIEIREPGSSKTHTIENGKLHPLRFMRQKEAQQLSLCFPGLNNNWSAPFHISNVGRVHIKLTKEKQPQKLIRAETLMENATLFIHLSITNHWPFTIRNESDTEVFFFQANPNVEEDDDEGSRSASGWKPVRYKLPPRSIMPYAWDYPASRNKNLWISAKGRERNCPACRNWSTDSTSFAATVSR